MYSYSGHFDLVSSGQVVVLGGNNSQPLIVVLECNQSMCVVTTHLDVLYEMERLLHPNRRRCHCLRLRVSCFLFSGGLFLFASPEQTFNTHLVGFQLHAT